MPPTDPPPTTDLRLVRAAVETYSQMVGTRSGADLFSRLIGRSVDYLGALPPASAEAGRRNVASIVGRAVALQGAKLDEPGGVPPRLLRDILLEGPFVDDAVVQAYYGGVLASSRSPDASDDRGKSYLAIIGRMSAVQVRAHFVMYTSVRRAGRLERDPSDWRGALSTFALGEFIDSLALPPAQRADFLPTLEHVCFFLVQEGLIADLAYGPPEAANRIYFTPTILGAQLYMWAQGLGTIPVSAFADPAQLISLPSDVGVKVPDLLDG